MRLRPLSRRARLALVAALSAAGVLAIYLQPGGSLQNTLALAALTLAALLASAFGIEAAPAMAPAFMPPSFVLIISALLLLGPRAALCVAAVAAVTPRLTPPVQPRPVLDRLAAPAAAVVATGLAGLAYTTLGGDTWGRAWPLQALPVAAAVSVWHAAQCLLMDVALPVISRRAVDPAWRIRALRSAPTYVAGAGIAAGLSEALGRQMWTILPIAAIPLGGAYRTYADYLTRLQDEARTREASGLLEVGLCLVGHDGRVTHWNDPLARILACPAVRAMGRPLVGAVPSLGGTELPRAVKEALADRTARTVLVRLPAAGEPRALRIKLVPVAEGLSLLWQDVTDDLRAEQALKRSGERLALAAAGANDGLWEWDLRNQEFYVSGRWWEMLGMPAAPGAVRPDAWLERVHPDDMADLKQALDAHLAGQSDVFQHEHRLRHENGTYRRFLCRGLAAAGSGRRPDRIAGSMTDTTEQAIAQERLRRVGFLDPLTGLWNREVFVEGLGRRLEEGKLGRAGSGFAVLYLDIDRFKIVNDSLGHLVGDEVLIGVSRRLESCLRQGDALARLGGDEFAILLTGLVDDGQANAIAFRIQEALKEPFSTGGREVFTSASIGIAFGPAHYTNPDEVMRDADTAMYHAKSRGKARHEVFDAVMHARMRDRLSLENDLRRAVAAHDFEVHYQPIVALTTGMCVGFESLVRWTRNGEPVSPATFIPIAEEMGLVEHIGTWVLQQACAAFADWQRRFPQAGLECITVNVSSRQLMQHNFLRIVQQAVQESGVRRADLRVEITETALMDNPGEAAGLLRDLRNYGVKVYLDDFGTGYSSLSHLHKLPVDALKIDRSFVKSLLLPDRPAIVESILALARTLKTSVVAEGIESDGQARELERLGCTHAQGFLFSRPISATAVEALLRAHAPLGPKAAPAPQPQVGYWPDAAVIGPLAPLDNRRATV